MSNFKKGSFIVALVAITLIIAVIQAQDSSFHLVLGLFVVVTAAKVINKVWIAPYWGLTSAVALMFLDSQPMALPLPFNLTFSNILLTMVMLSLIVKSRFSPGHFARVVSAAAYPPATFFSALLFLAATISIFSATYPAAVLRLLVTLLGCILVLILSQLLVCSLNDVSHLLAMYALGAVTCASIGTAQSLLAKYGGIVLGKVGWAIGETPLSDSFIGLPRIAATWNDPNIYALYLIPALIFVPILRLPLLGKALTLFILLCGFSLSYSRSAYIGYATAVLVALTLTILTSWDSTQPKLRTIIKRFPFVLSGLVTLIFLLPLGQIWEQLLLWNTASFYGRIDMSQIGWKFFRTSPMWGIGPGNLLLVAGVFTHNSHLGILIEYGIIGATAWAGLLLVTIKCGFIGYTRTLNNNERKLAIAALATLIGLLTGGLAIELQNNKFVWLVFAVLIILGRTSIRLEIAKSDLMERYHIV